ncbi:MAG: hypothetical protein R2716_07030 [Microthrixaceae bacterium]
MSLALGLALAGSLVLWERMRAPGTGPADPPGLFGIRRYGFGNVVALVVSLGEFGILFAPLWIQAVHGFDPLVTGAILATLAVGTLTAGAARHVSAAIGPTWVVRTGMVLEIAGIVAIGATVSVTRSPWWLSAGLVLYGLGVSFATAQLTNVVLADVPEESSGQASAMTSTFRQVGSALGAACLGGAVRILGSTLTNTLEQTPGVSQDQAARSRAPCGTPRARRSRSSSRSRRWSPRPTTPGTRSPLPPAPPPGWRRASSSWACSSASGCRPTPEPAERGDQPSTSSAAVRIWSGPEGYIVTVVTGLSRQTSRRSAMRAGGPTSEISSANSVGTTETASSLRPRGTAPGCGGPLPRSPCVPSGRCGSSCPSRPCP